MTCFLLVAESCKDNRDVSEQNKEIENNDLEEHEMREGCNSSWLGINKGIREVRKWGTTTRRRRYTSNKFKSIEINIEES